MHDECVTCAKKCTVAMGANVLKCVPGQTVFQIDMVLIHELHIFELRIETKFEVCD